MYQKNFMARYLKIKHAVAHKEYINIDLVSKLEEIAV